MNYLLLHFGDTMYPDEFKVPKAPDDWVDPPPNTENVEPTFDKVDNPGGYNSFSYFPLFESDA